MINSSIASQLVVMSTLSIVAVSSTPTIEISSEFQEAIWIAFYGALGGSARWLHKRENWREGFRLLLLGAILATGMGNLSVLIIDNYLGDVPDSIWNQPKTPRNIAFFVGMFSALIMGLFADVSKQKDQPK